MTTHVIEHAEIVGLCCALPGESVPIQELNVAFSEKELTKFMKMTGISQMHRVNQSQTTADLCELAASKLLDDLGWESSSVGGIIFLSQTPDYIMPATACILQARLGLSMDSFAFDVNLGCSGYVYGLWLASKLVSPTCRRILLLNGDTCSKYISSEDKATSLIFGDAGAATAIEYTEQSVSSSFLLGTDGAGYENIIVRGGGSRTRGEHLTNNNIEMNGVEVFNFTISQVPRLIERVLELHQWNKEEVDLFALHQANKYIIQQISGKLNISGEKMPTNIEKYGNTSSASIPLVMYDVLRQHEKGKRLHMIAAGFGVGYSWAGAAIDLSKTNYSELVYL